MANWNGQATTSDAAVPSTDWANHQRLHQYRGAHNETYGGVTINIDSDYLDAATATGGATGAQAPPPPRLSVSPSASGLTTLSAVWGGSRSRVLAGAGRHQLRTRSARSPRRPPAVGKTTITVRSSAPYFAVQALDPNGVWLANSPTVSTPSHLLLFGHSVFVGAGSGVGGVPAGCYLPTPCHVVDHGVARPTHAGQNRP